MKNSLSRARKVEVLDTLSNETNVFNSINQASKFIGCSETAIRKVLKEAREWVSQTHTHRRKKKVSRLINQKYIVRPM